MAREGQVDRKTKETNVKLSLRLEGDGTGKVETGVPFLDHMLTLFFRHGLFDLTIVAKGDIEVDYHHLVEDVGICLGEAFRKALGDMKGITRYGHAVVPMIEALAAVTVDVSARPHLVYRSPLGNEKVGKFDVELVEEFMRAFAQSSGVCLHVNIQYGSNAHHTVEAVFKALGRAMSTAVRLDPRVQGVPSTKGVLG
ncbi:MAG: imidazoleglycerol-phosphate dehydratase HisB [Deltaproteobacteria bacterium]|nr:MAG: imidazoleglycerol-phosphate dehydratase HisB [Deltaproteobacteria bacterium]